MQQHHNNHHSQHHQDSHHTLNPFKDEALRLLLSFAVFFIILSIVFKNSEIIVNLKVALGIYWLYVLPGFMIMLYWQKQLRFIERLFIGFMLGAAIMGIASYYLGIAGLSINYHHYVLPIILILLGVFLAFKSARNEDNKKQ